MYALLFGSGIFKNAALPDVIVDLKLVPELCTVKVRMYVCMYVCTYVRMYLFVDSEHLAERCACMCACSVICLS